MTKSTLLLIGNHLPTDKYNKNVWHSLAEHLERAGWHVITTSSKENRFLRLMDMLKTIWQERNNYHLAQVDVFSGKAFIFAEVCCTALNRRKKPVVLILHGGGLPEFSLQHPHRMRRLLQTATAVVTPSAFLQQELHRFCQEIKVIPNPIDLSKSIFRLRQNPTPSLVWVRAFHKVYNPTLAIEVLSRLKNCFPYIHLTMIGPDKRDKSLTRVRTLIDQYHLHDHVKLIPGLSHEKIPAQLNEADIFINTSNYDTLPRSLIEAMANGLCIVSTNVGGIPNLINDQEDALLVPPDQPEKMAAAVNKILTENELAYYLSQNARYKAEGYDWSAILPQWENLFTALIEGNHG